MSGVEEAVGPMADKKRSVNLDIKQAEVKDIALGDKVTVIMEGTVERLSTPYEYTDGKGKVHKDPYGDMRLNASSIKVRETTKENVFSKIVEDY